MSAIYKQMTKVMKCIKSVGKDSTNTQQGFKFRGIDALVNALYPLLCEHEVFILPRVVSEQHEIRDVVRSSGKPGVDKHVSLLVEYDFVTVDGSKVTVGPIAAEGLDSGDKATNKALSSALKYALIQTFSVPTEDMAEADFESPVISKPTVEATTTEENNAAPVQKKPINKFRRDTPKPATTGSEDLI